MYQIITSYASSTNLRHGQEDLNKADATARCSERGSVHSGHLTSSPPKWRIQKIPTLTGSLWGLNETVCVECTA